MDQQSTATSPVNGASTAHELFALTDEQILEIEPEGEVNVAPPGARPDEVGMAASSPTRAQSNGAAPPGNQGHSPSVILSEPQASEGSQLNSNRGSSEPEIPRGATAQAGVPVLQDPPAWLAAQMKDPRNGEEARELWNGVQEAKQEAAAYRAAFATPEEARALKELYPGGMNEARAATERARVLDDIDRAYFGTAGSSAEQTSAARAQLAAMMLREDPAAFREMVIAGLRALEEAEKGSGSSASTPGLPHLAQALGANRSDAGVAPPFRAASSEAGRQQTPKDAGLKPGATSASPSVSQGMNGTEQAVVVAQYAAFEKAANEDLERSVGAAIARTIEQALPNISKTDRASPVGAQHAAPLQARLSAAVRQDVEAALKGDRQLGEQIAQILSARRFDNETRAQVVRLIDDRARQLVPGAAKRVLNDWTQSTLAAHRGRTAKSDAANARREVSPASSPVGSPREARGQTSPALDRGATPPSARRVNYSKLSDEQILDL